MLVSRASWLQLALSFLVLLALYAAIGWHRFIAGLVMIRRLRWLFLSILILSLWFTPGDAIIDSLGGWSPTIDGLNFGVHRIIILVGIVLAVNILLVTTTTEKLIAALQWLLNPLGYLHVPADKIAIRIVMTINAVRQPELNMREIVSEENNGNIWQRIVGVVLNAYNRTLVNSEIPRPEKITLERLHPPAPGQWLWLVALVVVYQLPIWVI